MLWYGTPNSLSYAALVLWGPITLVLFARLRPALAAAISLVGGVLLLPEVVFFNPPILPELDKRTIPPLAAMVGCLLSSAARQRIAAARPFRGVDLLFLLMIAGNALTTATNTDVLAYGKPRPGMTASDMIAYSLADVFAVYIPFLLGRALFRTSRDLRTLLWVCLVGALLYVPLCLFEMVMSPVLHSRVYGFMQHDIRQAIRAGGFRPLVFMTHGIVLARFLLLAVLGGVLLHRSKLAGRFVAAVAGLVGLTLIACKSTGAIVLGAVLVPLMVWTKPKLQLRAALVMAAIVATYPLSRGSDLFPTDTLLELAEMISPQRADSLGARFESEDMLLEKARRRPLFGWGPASRSHVFNEVTGDDMTIVDGEWIIVFGIRGVLGFLAWYALYLVPVLVARRSARQVGLEQNRLLLAGFALIGVLLAVETLPNSSATIPQFFWSGALFGFARNIRRQDRLLRLRALWARTRRNPAPPQPAQVRSARL